jgi:glycine cleavage system H protein
LTTPTNGLDVPDELLYTRDHEWLRRDDADASEAVIGITAHAQDQLGDVVYLDLPAAGDTFAGGQRFGEIESVKTVSDLFAPVAGEVIEVNAALTDSPELVNQAPYGDGWLLRIRLAEPADLDGLLDATAYRAQLPAG